ncbi:MAG: hypothetical protein O7B99_08310, partial [Planctomycetota bacterium]|nr:hypothetical protein [Planctomycetota bacterium]
RRLGAAGLRLGAHGERVLAVAGTRLALAARSLESTSPLAVLGRGYSVTTRAGDARPLTEAGDLAPGDALESRLARGLVRSRVESVAASDDSIEEAQDPKEGA